MSVSLRARALAVTPILAWGMMGKGIGLAQYEPLAGRNAVWLYLQTEEKVLPLVANPCSALSSSLGLVLCGDYDYLVCLTD